MRTLPSMTQIKDGESMATLCMRVCVCVCCVRTRKCASPWKKKKKALGADLLKELITGGKAALVTVACGLWPDGVGGTVWHVRSKGSDACLSTLWTHLTVRVSPQSELATLLTAVSWWMIKYENMAQMIKTAIKENTRVVLWIFYLHKQTLAGVKKVMRGQGSGWY